MKKIAKIVAAVAVTMGGVVSITAALTAPAEAGVWFNMGVAAPPYWGGYYGPVYGGYYGPVYGGGYYVGSYPAYYPYYRRYWGPRYYGWYGYRGWHGAYYRRWW